VVGFWLRPTNSCCGTLGAVVMTDNSYLISCDWGTSAFRLRLLQGTESPKILAERSTSRGISTFSAGEVDEFQNYLILELDRLFRSARRSPEPIPVYLSGMITSTLGWKELPYAELPFPLEGSRAIVARTVLQRVYGNHALVFFSGVKSADDVLRGEETELLGIIQDPELRKWHKSSVVLLPGTHSKVIELEDRAIAGFRTYLTGELFQVLRRNSILRHSVDVEPEKDELAWELFRSGVERARQSGLLESLFTVRSNVLLKRIPPSVNTFYLSGLLIGAEVASVHNRYPSPRSIILGGTRKLQELYHCAFQVLNDSSRVHLVSEEVTSIASALGHWSLRAVVENDSVGFTRQESQTQSDP